jgi:hypothetical protein
MKMEKVKMQFCVEVGLLILSLSFIVSLFGSVGLVGLGEEWRLIVVLEENPHHYLEYMRREFLYLILPPAVGLAFSIIGYMRERKSPTGVLGWWLPLAVFGGFFFLWGLLGLWWTYASYCDALAEAVYSSVDLAGPLLAVYAMVWVGGILWLIAGVLFMLSPLFKMMLRNKGFCRSVTTL